MNEPEKHKSLKYHEKFKEILRSIITEGLPAGDALDLVATFFINFLLKVTIKEEDFVELMKRISEAYNTECKLRSPVSDDKTLGARNAE